MLITQKCCALVLLVVSSCILVENRSYNNGLIFYDLQTKQAYLPPTVSVSRGRGLANIKFSDKGSIWSTFGKPCDCAGPLCSCCVGIKVKQYNFDQKMCANVSYVQPKNEINLEMFLDEKQSAKYAVSARNPSPFCIPVMLGIPMSMCVQMSNVGLQGDNMNACMDFMVQLASTQIFEMHFQCMQVGAQGAQWVLPGGAPVIPPSQSKITDRSENASNEYYDEEEDAEENVIGTDDQVHKEESHMMGDDENKAEEELDYNDLTEEENHSENTKENEVQLSKENDIETTHDIITGSDTTTAYVKTEMITENPNENLKTNNDKSSEVQGFDMLTNTGDITMETSDGLDNSNLSTETTIEFEETDKQFDNLSNIKPSMVTEMIEDKSVEEIDTTLTIESTTLSTFTSSTTTTAPVLALPKITETPQSDATSHLEENDDNDNSQDNDSEYEYEDEDEESDEDDDEADEEEAEEEDEIEEPDSNSVEVKEPEKPKVEQLSTAAANDINKNATVDIIDDHTEENEETHDSEEYEEDYEEDVTEVVSQESQVDNGFMTATIATVPADRVTASLDATINSVSSESAANTDNVTNPQLSIDDMLNAKDNITNSRSNKTSNGFSLIGDGQVVAVAMDDATAATNGPHEVVNTTTVTANDSATPLTRAHKLITPHKPSQAPTHRGHQRYHHFYPQLQQSQHHNTRHQRYNRHHHDV